LAPLVFMASTDTSARSFPCSAKPDPRRQVDLYAATQPGIHRRSGPLLRALAAAAASVKEHR